MESRKVLPDTIPEDVLIHGVPVPKHRTGSDWMTSRRCETRWSS
jgi:hypothetical protein